VLACGQVAAQPLEAFQGGGISAIGKNGGPLSLARIIAIRGEEEESGAGARALKIFKKRRA